MCELMGKNKPKFDFDLDKINKTGKKFKTKADFNDAIQQSAKRALMPMQRAVQDAKKYFEFNMPSINLPEPIEIDLSHIYKKQGEEAEIRRLTLENLRSDKSQQFENPKFDPARSILKFADKEILIDKTADSNQHSFCKTLFKDMTSMRQIWNWDEMLESWGDDPDGFNKQSWRKVYNAAIEVNNKVAIETGIKDLLDFTTKTTCVNLSYLKKPRKS